MYLPTVRRLRSWSRIQETVRFPRLRTLQFNRARWPETTVTFPEWLERGGGIRPIQKLFGYNLLVLQNRGLRSRITLRQCKGRNQRNLREQFPLKSRGQCCTWPWSVKHICLLSFMKSLGVRWTKKNSGLTQKWVPPAKSKKLPRQHSFYTDTAAYLDENEFLQLCIKPITSPGQ